MIYIETELQERAREETFRLKRVKQNKQKKSGTDKQAICICDKIQEEEEEEDSKTICPICSAHDISEETLAPNLSAGQKSPKDDEDSKRLQYLVEHVDKIIESLMKQKGTSKDAEKLIDTCNIFKGSIKSFTSTPQLQMKTSTATLSSIKRDNTNSIIKSDTACCRPKETEEIGKNLKEISPVRVTSSEYHKHCLESDNQMKCVMESQSKTNTQKKQPCCVRETASEYHNRCLEPDPRSKCVSASQLKSEVNTKTHSTCPVCSKKSKSVGTFDGKSSTKTCYSGKKNGISPKKFPELSFKSNKQDPGMMVKPSICSSQEKLNRGVKKSGATEAIWRDTWTSTTDLKVIPSKSALKGTSNSKNDRSTCAIKVIVKPSSRYKSDGQSIGSASTMSECLTCNYSSKTKGLSDINTSLCKSCRNKSESKTKRGISDPSFCRRCQMNNNKIKTKTSNNKCPRCEKEKTAYKHICPVCQSDDSSVSEFQGRINLSSDKSKCFVCGKDKNDKSQTVVDSPGIKCSILSFIKSKIFGQEGEELPCPCCGITKATGKCEHSCNFSKTTKSSEDLNTSGSFSLSNKSCGVETDQCRSCGSSNSPTYISDSESEVCCGTQTMTDPTPKHSCKFDDKVKVTRISEPVRSVTNTLQPSQSTSKMRDVGVNTKVADRYDVRPVHMMPNSSRISCTCKPQNPSKVCSCNSEPICSSKPKSLRRVRSLDR
ncbi:unnamed protein product [Diatraea saccharalis]|uniref:Uncharacterized protein n=1 Tax=Diatraea saccharalis TaxID=40085 RepID=A0A9N9WKF9_9NEOP|nr:unnamed protein product [Diatraea saccharalis]